MIYMKRISFLFLLLTLLLLFLCSCEEPPPAQEPPAPEEAPRACEHIMGEWAVLREADCLTEGERARICQLCLEKETEPIPLAAHTPVTDEPIPSTCTEAGRTGGSHCAVCDKILSACERVPLAAHTPVTDEPIPPTCTEAGRTGGSHCAVCDKVLSACETVSPLGHDYGEPSFLWEGFETARALLVCARDGAHSESLPATVTSAPTGVLCGELCYTASVVWEEKSYTDSRTDTLTAPRHTETVLEAKTPTCTEEGATEGTYCSACGETLTKSEIIPAKGHRYAAAEQRPAREGAWQILHTCEGCADSYAVVSEGIEGLYLEAGALDAAGAEVPSDRAVRTVFLWAENMRAAPAPDLAVTVCFYSDTAFIASYRGDFGASVYIAEHMPEGAVCFRLVLSAEEGERLTAEEARALVSFEKFGEMAREMPDVPESAGAYNVLLRFEQMVKLTYYPLRDIPQRTGDFAANEKWRGLPYSSTRPEALFVPNNVSLYTFVTSLKNPNSYLYTVDLGEAPYNNVNGDTYYGAVCSTAAAYALNIIPNYSTHQWASIPQMRVLEEQSVWALKLCDTIVGEGHVVMVTGITRAADGRITAIYISQASGNLVKRERFTPDQIQKRYPVSKYTYCRYEGLKDVPYTPSPYVAVGKEAPVSYTVDLPLIPRKGDRANWLYGTDIEIDVLEMGDYTHVAVEREGERVMLLPVSALITLKGLTPGYYTAVLTDGERESAACSFAVSEVSSSAAAIGKNGEVRVTFSSSEEARPLWVQWMSTQNGTVHISTLTEEEIAKGEAVCAHEAGTYKVRVAFKTEYGIIHSALPQAIKVK